MPLVQDSISNDFIDKTTEKRIIIFMNKEMTEGSATKADLSVQKVIEEDSIYSEEHHLGSSTSLLFEIQKTKHAYVYSTDSSIYKAETFIDFEELKNVNFIEGESFYILPVGFEDDYSFIIEKHGVDTILEWFNHEDPFLNVFNEIHKCLGNNPEEYIY